MLGGDYTAYKDKAAAYRYINDFQRENYERITVLVNKGEKAGIQAAANKAGFDTVSKYIVQAIRERMERDGYQEPGGGGTNGND